MLGERKIKIADVARDTGIHRGTITRLYQEAAVRVELETLEKLCAYLECSIGDLLEYQKEKNGELTPKSPVSTLSQVSNDRWQI